MIYFVGIDPGLRYTGWAIVDPVGTLVACGLSRGAKEGRGAEAWRRVAVQTVEDFHAARLDLGTVRGSDCSATIELPQVYTAGKRKGDPDDLIVLAAVVGAIAANAPLLETTIVRPAEWKGQVPKDVHQRRLLAELRKEELEALGRVSCPPSLRHNVIDAIGIAKWAQRRAGRSGPW